MLKISSILSSVSVEPTYFLFSLSFGLCLIVSQELLISKVCKVNLQYPEEVCDSIQQHEEEQIAVQKYTSTITIMIYVLNGMPGMIFALFAGNWSDMHGRKFLLLSSQFGVLLGNTVNLINTFFFYELRAEFLLLSCVQEFFGGFVVFFMAANAHLTDVTEPDKRTIRMVLLCGLWPIGFNAGKALGSVVKTQFGFLSTMAIALLATILGFLCTLLFVEESIHMKRATVKQQEALISEKHSQRGSLKNKLASLFNFQNIYAGFNALLKKREHGIRKYLLLLAFCFEIEHFVNVGDWSYQYLYLRKKIQIDLEGYTRYTIVTGILGVIAQYTLIPVLSGYFKLHDILIILINIGGCIIRSIIFVFATKEWNLYVGGAVAFLEASSYSIIRCVVSKYVDNDEVGKIYAIFGALQGLMPILASPFFGVIYRSTVDILPEAFILVQIACYTADWIVLVAIFLGLRKAPQVDLLQTEHSEAQTDDWTPTSAESQAKGSTQSGNIAIIC